MIMAPWTSDQVDALNRYQRFGIVHPFTCTQDHGIADNNLVATRKGWICCHCGYTQNWAHVAMLGEPDPQEYLRPMVAPAREPQNLSIAAMIFVALTIGMAATFSLAQHGGFSGLHREFLDFFRLR